jgi:aminopeptidase N
VDIALDLTADFGQRTLAGTATLRIESEPGAREIVLDTRDLTIESVAEPSGQPLAFTLGEPEPVLGRPLRVTLPENNRSIVIRYRTSPEAAALQWLAPEQTAGGRHPYLLSQGQAILTRTWIPTQDSPGIRQTYSARITVPAPLKAVMSAEHLTPDGRDTPRGRVFEFRMDKPIPPYLIAIAAGDIAFKAIGSGPQSRTGVFAEPSVLDRAAYEFADLEKMLEAAEALYGPYRWGRYDILVLPPSFPFGGMENPRLTFVSPTVLAGDRSLTSLAAHELAHSWSGNLVSNATWRDFWLNEGFTAYFENRIMEQLYGRERAVMLELVGRQDLTEDLTRLADRPEDTVLHIDLAGRNPDEGGTSVPYDKGAAFLRMLELHFGRDRFDAWLREYFDRHAFQSITTPQFLEYLRATLLGGDRELEGRLQIREWLFEPGLPSNAPEPVSNAFVEVERQARRFADGAPAASLQTRDWTTQEWQRFFGALPEWLEPARLADLDRTFNLSQKGNSEVLFLWLRLALRNRYEPALPAAERFLTSQGRTKFVRPLFEALVQSEWGRPIARQIYEEARPLYHAATRTAVEGVFTELKIENRK